jgi:hypothetical protein
MAKKSAGWGTLRNGRQYKGATEAAPASHFPDVPGSRMAKAETESGTEWRACHDGGYVPPDPRSTWGHSREGSLRLCAWGAFIGSFSKTSISQVLRCAMPLCGHGTLLFMAKPRKAQSSKTQDSRTFTRADFERALRRAVSTPFQRPAPKSQRRSDSQSHGGCT